MSLDPATFNLATPRHVMSDAELLGALRSFAAARPGRAFSEREFNAWKDRPCCGATIHKRFGTWRRALLEIGVKGSKCWAHDPEELVANLEAVWRRLGRAPGQKKIKELGTVSYPPYQKHWGSVREACRRLALGHVGATVEAPAKTTTSR